MDNKLIIHPRKPAYVKTTVVSARLPDDLLKQLDSLCQKTGRTRNELLVTCIEFALEHAEVADE